MLFFIGVIASVSVIIALLIMLRHPSGKRDGEQASGDFQPTTAVRSHSDPDTTSDDIRELVAAKTLGRLDPGSPQASGSGGEVWLDLWTDASSLVLFDPELFEVQGEAFMDNSAKLEAVCEGRFVMVHLQEDSVFRARLTDGSLAQGEEPLVNETLGPLGLVVRSGRIYVSGMDLPRTTVEECARYGAGAFVELPPVEYAVLVYELDLELTPEDARPALPNYVVRVQPGPSPIVPRTEVPRFTGGRSMERFLAEVEKQYGAKRSHGDARGDMAEPQGQSAIGGNHALDCISSIGMARGPAGCERLLRQSLRRCPPSIPPGVRGGNGSGGGLFANRRAAA